MTTFFPIKNWYGANHKVKGLYIEGNTLTFKQAEGYHNENHSFDISLIKEVRHHTYFKLIFLVIVTQWSYNNSILFVDQEGYLLGSIAIEKIKAKELKELLQTLKRKNSYIKFYLIN